jgi:tRNA nucleotidyltransferase (CCA-adding enzyme)
MSAAETLGLSDPMLELPSGALLEKARLVARAVGESAHRQAEVSRHVTRALLVGGWVRDALSGQSPKDADLEVFGVQPEELRKLLRRFGHVDCVGESFRVYKLSWHEQRSRGGADAADSARERYELDVSIPRRDRKTGEGHKGFEIEGDPFASFEDAARRRDFTINAIGCDPLTGEILDPYHGRRDLQNRVLRVVDPRHFGEDSLRVLRAMQFAARFELTLHPDLVELCQTIELSDLPRERIWGEWEKLLTRADMPSWGLRSAHELGILEKLFPYLETAMQQQGDILCANLDRAAKERQYLPYEQQVTLMLAAIGLSLNKAEVASLLDDLGVFTINRYDVRDNALRLRDDSSQIGDCYEFRTDVNLRKQDGGYFRRIAVRCNPILLYHLARAQGESEAAEWFLAKMRELGVESGPPAPLLMGRHLLEMGLKPGPRMGEITRAVYEKQLDGNVTNLDEALAAARELVTI